MAGRRGWGSIIFRNGKAYAQLTLDGRRTLRLLTLDDEDRSPCPDDLPTAEAAMQRLRGELQEASELQRGTRARLRTWLDEEYAAILGARLASKHVLAQHVAYCVRVADWMESARGDVYLHEVTRADAQRFCADFLGKGLKPSYLRRTVNVVRKAWNDAIERGFCDDNPWSRIEMPRIEETHVPWVDPGALPGLYAELPRFQRAFVTLVGETGMRPGEALALRREDVDLEREQIHVRRGKTRAARRTIPLTPRALEVLRRQRKRADGLVVAPRATQGTNDAIATACRHLGLPKLTLRSLRHAYASHLVVAGVPPTVVAALLGHSDGGALVLRLYGRWYPPDAQSRATAALAAFRSTPGTAPSSPGTAARSPGRRRPGRARRASRRR